MKRTLLALIVLFLQSVVQAQIPKTFPLDDAGFLKEFGAMFINTNRTDLKETITAFNSAYNSPAITPAIKESVKQSALLLLQKKAQISPVFDRFAKMVISISSGGQQAAGLEQTMAVLPKLLETITPGNFSDYNKYIDFIISFHTNGKILESQSKYWKCSGTAKVKWDGTQPVVSFSKGILSAASKGDSIQILETSGDYNPITYHWSGNAGKVTWGRAGLDPSKVYVTFDKFIINLEKGEFTIDSVALTLQPYLKEPMLGSFQEKLFTTIDKSSFNFPRFYSYDKHVNIVQISKEVKYDGGFALEGGQIAGTGSDTSRATVTITNANGEPLVVARSYRFFIKNFEDINSSDAKVWVNFKEGAIEHPSSYFSYNTISRKVRISKGDGIYQKVPYLSEYHGMNMYVSALEYDIDSSFVKLLPLSVGGESTAAFESRDFYVKDMERRYRGVTNYDPLSVLKKYCEDNYTYTIPFDYIPGMLGYGVNRETTERLLFRMTEDGYITFDPVTREVEVLDRTFNHVKAGQNLVDYDVLRFDSKVVKEHGRLNVKNGQIAVFGVKRLRFSAVQSVFAQPFSDTIILGKDRNISFSGLIAAGKLNIYSKEAKFNYQDFKFDLPKIDSLKIMVLDRLPGLEGNYDYVEAKTAITNVRGELKIDFPNNKSSNKYYPYFPVFTALDSSKVYYNSVNKEYDSTSFYFEVYPFELDSLNTIEGEKMTFNGRMVSNGIFEPFESAMGVQYDLSLGFKHSFIEPTPMYNNSGTFQGNISLSSDGLGASGTIISRSAIIDIDTAVYYPDSVFAVANHFSLSDDLKNNTAQAEGGKSVMVWMPKQDTMTFKGIMDTLAFYQGQAIFNGDIRYGNKYLIGKGKLTSGDGILNSDVFEFKSKEVASKDASLTIQQSGYPAPILYEKNLSGALNFEKMNGTFRQTKDTIITVIPQINYLSEAAGYEWDMNNKRLILQPGNNQKTFRLLALSPQFDSLSLQATRAVFDINNNTLKVEGVAGITVADSKVLPDSGIVYIESTGNLRQLSNARLVMNNEKVNHNIERCVLDIQNRNSLSGEGVMSIKSASSTYTVKVADLAVVKKPAIEKGKKVDVPVLAVLPEEPAMYIGGNVLVGEEDNFRLSDKIFFKGKIMIRSYQPEFDLQGYGKLDIRVENTPGWFTLNQPVDVKKSLLSIDSLKDESGADLFTGLFLNLDNLSLSPIFMAPSSASEIPVIQVQGSLKYEGNEEKWTFGDKETITGKQAIGDQMVYNEHNGDIKISGEFTPGFNFETVGIKAYAQAKKEAIDTAYSFSLAIGFNFLLDVTIWDKLARDIQEYNVKASRSNLTKNIFLQHAMYSMYSDKQYGLDQAKNLETNGSFIPGENWKWPLFLSDMTMQWDPIEGNYKSAGPATVVMVGSKLIKEKVKCFLEMGYLRGADYFNLYLETANDTWYYFTYTQGQMYTISSDESYNTAVGLIKADKRTIMEKKELKYLYDIGDLGMKNVFYERMSSYVASKTTPKAEEISPVPAPENTIPTPEGEEGK